jgi:hypothetical protein
MASVSDQFRAGGGIDPSATTFRDVSGKNKKSRAKNTPPSMRRNQKTQCHSRYWEIKPPIMGDIEGPRMDPSEENAM